MCSFLRQQRAIGPWCGSSGNTSYRKNVWQCNHQSLFQSKTKVPKYFWKLIMMCHPKLYSDCAYKSQLWIKLLLCSMQCKENMIGKHRFSFYKSQQMVRLLQLVLEIYAWIKWNSSSLSFAAYNHCCIISCCFVLYPETKTNLWRTVPQGTLL